MNGITKHSPAIIFRALSEETRLRLLRVLTVAEFSVVELTEILDAPQSTISRHLARLREADLVETRRQGTMVFYSRSDDEPPYLREILAHSSEKQGDQDTDLINAEKVLENRRKLSQTYFDGVARKYSAMAEPGGSWQALAGALAFGFDGQVVADIGAGEGELTMLLAQSARMVYAIDHSRQMVNLLMERASGAKNITVKAGDFEDLPIENEACDVVIASQILHHCPRPQKALAEAGRITKSGGRLILIDLQSHDLEWTRERLADYWLGFDRAELEEWLTQAGFADLRSVRSPTSHEGLTALTVTGLRRRP